MTDGPTCLGDNDVMRFLVGAMDAAERARIEQHVSLCPGCAHLIGTAARESTPSADPRWSDLRPPILGPGTVVARRYTVQRFLGVGAMGEVHEATDALSGERVALKVLHATSTEDTKAVSRLRSEVVLAHRVTHPNVCRVFDLGSDPGNDAGAPGLLFLTMECLNGPTLASAIKDQGPLPLDRALPVLQQIAAGLAAAHAVGVVHRDLKASNVMLVDRADGTSRAVITDFGLADSLGQGAASWATRSMFCGTPAYAAPEQIAGGRTTPRSDVYSFGVLAFELLTGERPTGCVQCHHDASHDNASVEEHAPRLDATLPPALRGVVAQALSQRPEKRFADGAALVIALDHASLRMLHPLARRWPRIGLAAGGVATAALVTALWARSPVRPTDRPPAAPQPVIATAAAPAKVANVPAPPAVTPPGPGPEAAPAQAPLASALLPAGPTGNSTRATRRRLAARLPAPISPTAPATATAAEATAAPSDDLVRELRPRAHAPQAAVQDPHDVHDLIDPFAANKQLRGR